MVLTSSRLDIACARLIEAAKQLGGEDNITAIVAGVSGDVPRAVSGREHRRDVLCNSRIPASAARKCMSAAGCHNAWRH